MACNFQPFCSTSSLDLVLTFNLILSCVIPPSLFLALNLLYQFRCPIHHDITHGRHGARVASENGARVLKQVQCLTKPRKVGFENFIHYIEFSGRYLNSSPFSRAASHTSQPLHHCTGLQRPRRLTGKPLGS